MISLYIHIDITEKSELRARASLALQQSPHLFSDPSPSESVDEMSLINIISLNMYDGINIGKQVKRILDISSNTLSGVISSLEWQVVITIFVTIVSEILPDDLAFGFLFFDLAMRLFLEYLLSGFIPFDLLDILGLTVCRCIFIRFPSTPIGEHHYIVWILVRGLVSYLWEKWRREYTRRVLIAEQKRICEGIESALSSESFKEQIMQEWSQYVSKKVEIVKS